MDDLKKSKANITYFDLQKLTQQTDLFLKAMNERNCKIPLSQVAKPRSQSPNLLVLPTQPRSEQPWKPPYQKWIENPKMSVQPW